MSSGRSVAELMAELPHPLLLTLRRDFAIASFEEALRAFTGAGPYAEVEAAMRKVGDAASVQALAGLLASKSSPANPFSAGPPAQRQVLRCWTFGSNAAEVDAARTSVRSLPDDKRAALLEALRRGEPLCKVVKRTIGRAGSQALMKLGRPRAMWLLGANPDDPYTLDASAMLEAIGRGKKRRRRGRSCRGAVDVSMSGSEAESEDQMASDAEDEKPPQASGKKKKNSATMAFLEELREKRKLEPPVKKRKLEPPKA